MGKVPITRMNELAEFVTENIEHNNAILSSYCDHINGIEHRLQTLEYLKEPGINPNIGDQMPDQNKFLENIDKIADLNGDGIIDKVDATMFFKYIAAIYSSLVTLISVLFGVDETFFKENWPVYIILLFVSALFTVLLLYIKNIKAEKDAKIKATINTAKDLAKEITKLEYADMEKDHKHQLELIEKDFVIKTRDEMINSKFEELAQKYNKTIQ